MRRDGELWPQAGLVHTRICATATAGFDLPAGRRLPFALCLWPSRLGPPAAGALARGQVWVVWFRKEAKNVITWAGSTERDRSGVVMDGAMMPRTSFDTYVTVRILPELPVLPVVLPSPSTPHPIRPLLLSGGPDRAPPLAAFHHLLCLTQRDYCRPGRDV